MSRLPSFSRLYNRNCDTIFFICDLQEKFRPLIYNSETVISTTKFLNDALHVLEIPCVISEQNPKGLGKTVPEITIYDTTEVFEKQEFSMLDGIYRKLDKPNMRKQAILCGIEAHICVLQTALNLKYNDFDVHLVCDGVSSQRSYDRAVALQRMRDHGVILTTAESLIFDILGDASHPKFKQILSLIKQRNKEPYDFASSDIF